MKREEAVKIVKETFESAFDKAKYLHFIKNLLNEYKEAPFIYRGNLIPDSFDKYISTLERIGKYQDGENKIDILIVQLKKETSIERARTMQRNFIAWYLNGSRGDELKDAALVAFVSPDSHDWRFSLVKMEYRFVEDKKGRQKLKEKYTPARRWSFLVGTNESSHTAQSQLVSIVEDDKINPSLMCLEKAFNVETVTNEFFERYKNLYLGVKKSLEMVICKDKVIQKEFDDKAINTDDFSKKLLGQIVFLYFLQKKGWFGVKKDEDWGAGPKNFLRQLFEKKHANYNNFFNDILEPLFYEALATDRGERAYYEKFKSRIPFLNGGLFEPINNYDWGKTDIVLSNELFSNKTDSDSEGSGILDIFDLYNFTVKEDEPLEKEVAIDPEMLGKVFENLLPENLRKGQGAYYTPREIVHYMCQESLINYLVTELDGKVSNEDIRTLVVIGDASLENEITVKEKGKETKRYQFEIPQNIRDHAVFIDEKLITIRVCDPAIGSGAFPVGMMSEIVRVRNVLTPHISKKEGRSIYDYKRHAIQSCLYGVDVDPGAVEIAKLRMWLSLIVDEEEMKNIKPLPNLDYKIMQGNSLLQEYNGIKLFDEKYVEGIDINIQRAEYLKDKQSKLSKEYFQLDASGEFKVAEKAAIDLELKTIKKEIEHIRQNKNKYENEDWINDQNEAKKTADLLKVLHEQFRDETQKTKKDKLKERIEDLTWELIEKTLKEVGEKKEIDEVRCFRKTNTKPFFLWKLHFAEIFNEKGGFDIIIANPPYVGEKGNKEMFRKIKEGNLGAFYQGKMDLFYFFFHLAINLGKQNSSVAFISTNYYLTAMGAKKLREDFRSRTEIINLSNFNELKIFESALGQHNIITILKKNNNDASLAHTCITKRQGVATPEILYQILNGKDKETVYYDVCQKDLFDGDEFYIRMGGISVISNNPIQLVLQKIKKEGSSLSNLAFINQGVVSGCDYVSGRNYDKIKDKSKVEMNDGIFVFNVNNPRDKSVLKTFTSKEEKLLRPFFKNSDIKKYWCKTKPSKLLLYLGKDYSDISDCPNIKKHLDRYIHILKDRREVSNGRIKYFQLQWYRLEDIFIGEKIIVPYRSESNTFAYNDCEWFCRSDSYVLTLKEKELSLKYLLALLNSTLYYFWLYHRGKRKGEILELFQVPLSEIPIKVVLKNDQKQYVEIVDKILAITKKNDYLENESNKKTVREYENTIDKLVYKLYDLTSEEIKMVEEFRNSK